MSPSKKFIVNAKKCLDEANMELIAKKLNLLLDEHKVSTKVLSDTTSVSIALINNLKRGEGNPTIGTLNAICNFFNISLLELLGIESASSFQKNINAVSIFDLRFAHQRVEEYISTKMIIEAPQNTGVNTLFGIIINNNTLLPMYEKGSIFILTNAQDPIDGDIVLARIQNRTNVLNRLFIKKEHFYLKNLNIDDSLEPYNKDDIEILGIVIQIIQKII